MADLDYDLVIVGAGPGGFGAAVAGARAGLRTLLIDKAGTPGGVASFSCCPIFFGFGHEGKQIVSGIAEEVVRRLDKMGKTSFYLGDRVRMPELRPIEDRPLTRKIGSDTESIRLMYLNMLDEAGVDTLFYTHCYGAEVSGRKVTGLLVDALEGHRRISGKFFVDATADAHIVARAGGDVRVFTPDEAMHKSLFFVVDHVYPTDPDEGDARYQELRKAGKVPPGLLDYFARGYLPEPGKVLISMCKLTGGSGVDSRDMTKMDFEARKRIPGIVDFLRREIPGFADCRVVSSAAAVGVRAARCAVGRATVTPELLAAPGRPKDGIVLIRRSYGSHSTGERFHPDWKCDTPGVTSIPLGALLPVGFDNLAVAGRGISVHPHVMDAIRMMATCISTGQAIGILAGLLLRRDKSLADELPVNELQDKLKEAGQILSVED